jgi:choice-of-anchor B domain-containing protein
MLQRTIPFFALCLLSTFSLWAQNFNATFRSKLTFPGQRMANICGYAANGREYALVGGSKGLIIVDVTNPDAPVNLGQVPGPDNNWKEIKTYSHYAYVTSEGGMGVQIVDLSKLPAPNPAYKHYMGDGAINNQLNTIHALHIDTTAGYLYAYGSSLFQGGAVVLDLQDPNNPKYVGNFPELGYIHDGWVDNDTMYACHIYAGVFSIVDMRDKAKPVLLGAQRTPNAFPHNTWMSKDRTTIFTTDEVDNSYLTAYDIRNPEDIKLLDKIQAEPGSNSMVHNTHIVDNYAVTAWYKSGVSIVDVSRPENMVQVGLFDVAPAWQGGGSDGCWGVYPFLPSGTIVASIMSGSTASNVGELWVITPNYRRACYLEGRVTNAATGNPVASASIEIVNGTPGSADRTLADGTYKTGQATAGNIQVKVSAPGFVTATLPATLVSGEVTVLNVPLQLEATVAITGQVLVNGTNAPVPNAKISFSGPLNYEVQTDANGNFTAPAVSVGKYNVIAGAWGYGYANRNNQDLTTPQSFTFKLDKGYRDDFATDYGWEISGTSQTGRWEIGVPKKVEPGPGFLLVPGADVTADIGNKCYTTGNSTDAVGEDDVESGTMILRSPVMDLTTYNEPIFRALLFFTSITFDQTSLDSIKIFVENGTEEKLLYDLPGATFNWQTLAKKLKPEIAITKTMRIRIECFNDPAYTGLDSYEATFDWFRIQEGSPVGTEEALEGGKLEVRPNPFPEKVRIEYATPTLEDNYILAVYDIAGRRTSATPLPSGGGALEMGDDWQPGTYFARIEQNGRVAKTIKLIKLK